MAYEVTARRWRPQNFASVIGQDHVTTTLKNAIQSQQIAHAYLFSGPRGVGKTTTARILAKALNCVNGPTVTPCNECSLCLEIAEARSVDVLEIDGASNNKVEQVRSNLVETVNYTPSQGKHKIYIIDEVHMLSAASFNALLKTLEEPPAHVYFIFATTEPRKVLPTVLSRCQHFDFRPMSGQIIIDHLAMIAERSGYEIEQEALALIARRAGGSMRDAESLFDQVIAFGGDTLTARDVAGVLGLVEQDIYFELIDQVASHNVSQGLQLLDRILRHGYNMNEITLGILEHLRNLLIMKASPDTPDLLDAAVIDIERYRTQAERFQTGDLDRLTHLATGMEEAIKNSALPKVQLEVGIVRMIRMEPSVLLTDVMTRLSDLALRVAKGGPAMDTSSVVEATPVEDSPEPAPSQVSEEKSSKSPQPEEEGPPPETGLPEPKASDVQVAVRDLDLQVVTNAWPTVVDQIKEQRPAMGSFLTAATIVECRDNIVTLGFTSQYEFQKQQADKNKRVIQDALVQILGAPVSLTIITTENPSSEASDLLLQEVPVPEANADTIARQDPTVKRFLDAFDGKIISDS
ncbi:MAG: DNA polymerase III subunit gamma/tau [Gemmatimonadota bacterium]|nr:DNA polymerase III subunit gamma/tau [Gemmatimonadota bacterium]